MTYTGKCGHEGCQVDILPANTRAQFNRNRGLHMKIAHGIKGLSHTYAGRKILAQGRSRITAPAGLPMEQTSTPAILSREEQKRQYQKRYREMRKREKLMAASGNSTPNNGATLKFICPDCGCRVWTTSSPS